MRTGAQREDVVTHKTSSGDLERGQTVDWTHKRQNSSTPFTQREEEKWGAERGWSRKHMIHGQLCGGVGKVNGIVIEMLLEEINKSELSFFPYSIPITCWVNNRIHCQQSWDYWFFQQQWFEMVEKIVSWLTHWYCAKFLFCMLQATQTKFHEHTGWRLKSQSQNIGKLNQTLWSCRCQK